MYFNEDSCNVVFNCNEMGILNIDLNLALTLTIIILKKIILIPLFVSDFWHGVLIPLFISDFLLKSVSVVHNWGVLGHFGV